MQKFSMYQHTHNIYTINIISQDQLFINNIKNNNFIIDTSYLPSTTFFETLIYDILNNNYIKRTFNINEDNEMIIEGNTNIKISNIYYDFYYSKNTLIKILETFKNITFKKEIVININT